MAAEIIKASEVRAGDTLRVTLDMTAKVDLTGQVYAVDSVTCINLILNDGWTIERLPPPLKVGDRVLHVSTGGHGKPGVLVWTDGEFATVRWPASGVGSYPIEAIRLAPPAKVDGVFEVGDRVLCVDDSGVLCELRLGQVYTVHCVGPLTGGPFNGEPGVGVSKDELAMWRASRFVHAETEA